MATQPLEYETEGGSSFLSAIPSMLWQRRWFVIVPVIVCTVAGLVAAFVIHPVYQSNATVLIESQQVADDLIGALSGGGSSNDMIGQRIARARERVLSRQDLIRLIRTYNLYQREQRTTPLSKVVDKMRDDTTIIAIDNDIQMGNRKNMGGTIAINVGFQYDDPVKAQAVAQQFVDRFLEADASTQASQATDTVNFLTEQANTIQAQMAQLEGRANQIKLQNGGVLVLGGLGGQISDVTSIDAQISGLQAQVSKLAAQGRGGAPQDGAVAQAEAQLRVAQARFSDSHPDVRAAKAQLEAARAAAASRPTAGDPVAAELAADRAQLNTLVNARAAIVSRSSSLQSAAARAPALSGQVDQLEKAADVLRDQYRNIGVKMQAAQIQARMESEQKGERLTLADPPVVPDHPLRPNRPLIIASSIAGGFAIGLALVLLIELILRPIRGTGALRRVLGEPPLAVIPDFDQRPGWIVRMIERRVRRKANPQARA